MQRLEIHQSLWAMELRRPDGHERSLEGNMAMVAEAGFDGVGIDLGAADVAFAKRVEPLLAKYDLACQITAFPKSMKQWRETLALARDFDARFVNVIGQIMPLSVEGMIPVVRRHMELAEEAGITIHFETHRNCITNDLFATLLLLDAVPEMTLSADLSHYVVDREFVHPLSDHDQGLIRRVLERSEVFQGRVASREQIQLQLDFPQHRKWVDLFLGWWEQGLRGWRRRAPKDGVTNFLCELGPREYAITGRDGLELSDRWEEALVMKRWIEEIWARLETEERLGVG
jgi:hypothetical protein